MSDSDEIVPNPPDEETARRNARIIRRRRIERSPHLKARHQAMKIKTSKSALKKVLEICDPALTMSDCPPEVVDQLVDILGLQDIEWPSEIDRKHIVLEIVDNKLMRRLF